MSSRIAIRCSTCPIAAGFMRELERLVDRANRYGHHAAMLFVDLDGLKMINDTFGHRAGDGALIRLPIADQGRSAKRRGRPDRRRRVRGAAGKRQRGRAHRTAPGSGSDLRLRVHPYGDALPLSVAIGVGMIDGDDTPDSVMARADEEMYGESGGLNLAQIIRRATDRCRGVRRRSAEPVGISRPRSPRRRCSTDAFPSARSELPFAATSARFPARRPHNSAS